MGNEITSNSTQEESGPERTVDAVTRARIGSLSAHGIIDTQIADILLLTIEQVAACHNTEEFKKKYAEVADEQIQKQLDLADGWDGVEEKALEQVLTTLSFNRDPKYALIAAQIANRAQRRVGQSPHGPRVIDGSKQQNNIVVLNLNKTYITKASEEGGRNATIDVTPRVENKQRKITDLPSPKSVEELLAPVKKEKQKVLTELEQAFEISGVFKDDDEF